MATVRSPGSTFDYVLPEDEGKEPEEQTVFVLRVLNWVEWQQFLRKLENVTRSSSMVSVVDTARKAIGVGLVDVKNLKVVLPSGDVEEFKLELSGGDIAPASMAVLMPFKDRLIDAIHKASQLNMTDIKN